MQPATTQPVRNNIDRQLRRRLLLSDISPLPTARPSKPATSPDAQKPPPCGLRSSIFGALVHIREVTGSSPFSPTKKLSGRDRKPHGRGETPIRAVSAILGQKFIIGR